MRQRFQQILVLLFSGLVALSNQVIAGTLSQPATEFYGLSISNFGVTLQKQRPDSAPWVLEKTTLNTSELFGDPPNIYGNDSPVIFMTLFLSDKEATILKQNSEALTHKYGDQLRRQLYISAAGYDAAVRQNLTDTIGKTEITVAEHIKSSLKKSHLNRHFRCESEENIDSAEPDPLKGLKPKEPCIKDFKIVEQLEEFGCFNEPNKAEFNICATRWAFEFRTGIKFERHMIVMEQDSQAMSAMANKVVRDKKLPPRRHFILQATTFAQPYFNSPGGLIETGGWMGLFGKTGGYHQIGTGYSESLRKDFEASGSGNLTEFMSNPKTGLHHIVQCIFNLHLQRGHVYIAGNRVHDKAALLNRIKILYARNNMGDLLLRITDTGLHPALSNITKSSEEHLQKNLLAANVFINKARQYGAFSLALFLGLLEPALDDNAYLIIVGEQAEWFASSEGKSIAEVLLDIANDEKQFEDLYGAYYKMRTNSLSSDTFDHFLNISGGTKKHGDLHSGMSKEYVKEWLVSLAAKVNNVHFVPRSEYNDALLMAFRTRYTSVKRGITAQ